MKISEENVNKITHMVPIIFSFHSNFLFTLTSIPIYHPPVILLSNVLIDRIRRRRKKSKKKRKFIWIETTLRRIERKSKRKESKNNKKKRIKKTNVIKRYSRYILNLILSWDQYSKTAINYCVVYMLTSKEKKISLETEKK